MAIDRLCKLNNKILRILLMKRTDTIQLYKAYNTLPLPLLHESQIILLIHKIYYHKLLLPVIYRNCPIENNQIHNHFTRRNTDLHYMSVRCNTGQRCLFFHGSKFWNNVPQEIKLIQSIPVFKKKLTVFLLNK